jgi:hypothetical protein
MNKEQEELLDAAYENYSKEYEKDNSIGMCLLVKRLDGKSTYRKPNKEMFVDLCTYDKTFSKKWGLRIEERELSYSERRKYRANTIGTNYNQTEDDFYDLDKYNIPTKLITLEYNGIKTESYE